MSESLSIQAQPNPSLQWRLALWLSVITTMVALVSGVFAFAHSYYTALEYQDDLLRQTAALIQPQTQKNVDIQSDVEIYVRELGQSVMDGQVPISMSDGFHTLKFQQENYRVYVYTYPTGERLAFTQKTKFRDELAYTGAWSSTLPLLMLIPILTLMCFLIIRGLFRPLHRLSQQIEQRSEQLQPLSTDGIPKEVKGFVIAINHLLHRVATSIQQQQRFIADAAHELRSPLTALSLQTERLAQCSLSDEGKERLLTLQQGIQRQQHLLNQLLSLARTQAEPNMTAPAQALSVLSVYQQVISTLYPLAEQKNIDLGIRESEDVQLKVDETSLFTLLKNLVDNAIRYIPEDGQIDLAIEHHQNHVILIVEDNGQGIAPEHRERVLDAFYRVLGTQTQGSGLGLSIVHNIVQALHGKLYLKDSIEFEHGLRVEVHLTSSDKE